MIALLVAAVLQGEPNAGFCSIAYLIELRGRQNALGISRPFDPAKLSAEQRDKILALEPFLKEGMMWTAVAFSRNEAWAAIGPAYARLSGSPDEQAATFRDCSQFKAADQLPPFREALVPAPGAPDQCAAEDAAVHRQIQQHATADMIRAHALKAMSGIEHGALPCHSLEEARTAWMEIGAAAAAAVAKDEDPPAAK